MISKNTYEVLDSGEGYKLERLGSRILLRPAFNAIWPKDLSLKGWSSWDGAFRGQMDGGKGGWEMKHKVPPFTLSVEGLQVKCRLTAYGHIGFFFEQKDNWKWLRKVASEGGEVLNLFAYTGMSSLMSAWGGAKVTHVDSSKSVIHWARENFDLNKSKLKGSVRFIQEDVGRFVQRELKRGRKYEGIILDPPSFGRGAKGEVFKIEKDLYPLLKDLSSLLTASGFLLLSAHSHGFSKQVLKNIISSVWPEKKNIEAGEMLFREKNGRVLPSGCYARACH